MVKKYGHHRLIFMVCFVSTKPFFHVMLRSNNHHLHRDRHTFTYAHILFATASYGFVRGGECVSKCTSKSNRFECAKPNFFFRFSFALSLSFAIFF